VLPLALGCGAVPFEPDGDVPLILVFRHAGQITLDAPVTPPGTP
jgi:hypothetical protein